MGSYSMATLYMLANQAAFFPTGSAGEIIIHKSFIAWLNLDVLEDVTKVCVSTLSMSYHYR